MSNKARFYGRIHVEFGERRPGFDCSHHHLPVLNSWVNWKWTFWATVYLTWWKTQYTINLFVSWGYCYITRHDAWHHQVFSAMNLQLSNILWEDGKLVIKPWIHLNASNRVTADFKENLEGKSENSQGWKIVIYTPKALL